MTKQEMFEKAVKGLASQGWKPGYDEERRTCLYRTPDGRKCAMGHLIDDETAAKHEGKSANFVACELRWDYDSTWLAADMQMVHDSAADRGGDLRDAFVAFASLKGFTWPEGI